MGEHREGTNMQPEQWRDFNISGFNRLAQFPDVLHYSLAFSMHFFCLLYIFKHFGTMSEVGGKV